MWMKVSRAFHLALIKATGGKLITKEDLYRISIRLRKANKKNARK
jgi:hypothetical protein